MIKRLLVVDDEPKLLRALAVDLRGEGYDVMTARSGNEALICVAQKIPDLIVSDIMTPRIDGIQLVRALRSTPKYRKIPVLVVSAYGSGNLKEALNAGANAAMRKPINFDRFFEKKQP